MLRLRRASASTSGTVLRALSRSARPAWMPPSSGSMSRSKTCVPNRGRTRAPIERSSSAGTARRGSTRSRPARAMPRGESRPDSSRGSSRCGMPNMVLGGRVRRRPRDHTNDPPAPGATVASARSRSSSSARIAGARTMSASGPVSTRCPPMACVRTLPPSRSSRSTRTTSRFGQPAQPRWYAAASPLTPPPTTTTRCGVVTGDSSPGTGIWANVDQHPRGSWALGPMRPRRRCHAWRRRGCGKMDLVTASIELPGWTPTYSGKVRDLYVPDPAHPVGAAVLGRFGDVLLVVASDRISAYDHVLPTLIPDKGVVLTQLSLWWFDQLADLVPNHVVPGADNVVPAAVAGRAMVCRRLEMFPVECVARGYLTGSGLVEYLAKGEVTGIPLPAGLVDGSRLPGPIFTPATKAALGDHDKNVSFDVVAGQIGVDDAVRLRDLTLVVYARAEAIARERGLILADTKLEFGVDPVTGATVLGDEVLTPDSSRFWPADAWTPGRAQPSFDKQYVRDWLTSPASGWDRVGDIPPPPLPDDVVERTRSRYLEAFERLTGHPLA